jgi:hypothetical protein
MAQNKKHLEQVTLGAGGFEEVKIVEIELNESGEQGQAEGEQKARGSNKPTFYLPPAPRQASRTSDGKQNSLYLHNNKLCGCYKDEAKVSIPRKHARAVSDFSLAGADNSKGKDKDGLPLDTSNWLLVNYCVYQSFLDGWDFTPDVGMGSTRGEIFTPRFIVDYMISDLGILPERMVYEFNYKSLERKKEDKQNELRGYAGSKVLEPAVGTGNYISTILYHKLELVNELTGYKSSRQNGRTSYIKNPAQLARYQAYTLVVLGSLYINDIDPGNLQTTKWRFLRDNEIASPANIEFWVSHIEDNMSIKLDKKELKWTREYVNSSIQSASQNWASKDRDRGVLDVLYEKHTSEHAPDWLRSAWRKIIDANAQLFNGIQSEDTIEEGFVVPGYKKVIWTYWSFSYDLVQLDKQELQDLVSVTQKTLAELSSAALDNKLDNMLAHRTSVPLLRQMLSGEKEELESKVSAVFNLMSKEVREEYDKMHDEITLVGGVAGGPAGDSKQSFAGAAKSKHKIIEETQLSLFDIAIEDTALDLSEESVLSSSSKESRKEMLSLHNRKKKLEATLSLTPLVSKLESITLYKLD